MDTCIVAASSDQIYRRLLKDVVSLGVTAVNQTAGEATAETLAQGLAALRARHPEGEVIALIPESLAARVAHVAGIDIIPVPDVDSDADQVAGCLAIKGGIVVVMSEDQAAHRRRPTGWRRWLMPWRRVSELQTSVRAAVGVAAQDRVQGLAFARPTARGDLLRLGAIFKPRTESTWPTWGSK